MTYSITAAKTCRAAALMGLIVLSACSTASTEKRIENNPEKFTNLTGEQQMQVQSGNIETGYTKDMVYLAKGEPAEKRTRLLGTKKIETWVYRNPTVAEPANNTTSPGFHGAFTAPQIGPGPQSSTPMFYGSGRLVVEFENDKVRSVRGK